MARTGTSVYPATLDAFDRIGTANYEDESGYDHVNVHNEVMDGIEHLESVIGTTAGTSVLKNVLAGQFVATLTGTETFTNKTLTSPTINSPTIGGTPVLSEVASNAFYEDDIHRQAIINGNFDVWQRSTSSTAVTTGVYDLADRWKKWISADGGTLPTTITQSRQTVSAGELDGSKYYYRISPDGAGSGFGSAADHQIETLIENGNRLMCGAGKSVTVSLQARSSIANKKIGVAIWQGYGNGGTPTADEDIAGTSWTLTSSWTRYSHTFQTNTHVGKTFGTANDDLLGLSIFVMWGTGVFGSAVSSGGTAESYVGSGDIDIAQVQLCSGTVALPFKAKNIYDEIQACKRYCQRYGEDTNGIGIAIGHGINGGRVDVPFVFPVELYRTPTVTFSSLTANDSGVAESLNALNAASIYGKKSCALQFDCDSTATADRIYKIVTSSTAGFLQFASEIIQ